MAETVDPVSPREPCLACGCRVRVPGATTRGATYVVCPGCGLGHLDPLPADRSVREVFSDGYFEGAVPGGYDDYERDGALHRRNAGIRLDLVERLRGGHEPGRLLDVGCAFGHVLDEARDRGWETEGVEVAAGAAQVARRGGAVTVWDDLAQVAAARPGSFDVVTMFQLISHVPRPDAALAEARRCLRPGGVLVIETWNRESLVARLAGRRWHQLAPPSVLWTFGPTSLRLLLEGAGLRPEAFERARKWISARFVASLVEGAAGSRAHRLLGDRAEQLSVPYALGDLVWVAARRDDAKSAPRAA